MHLIYLNCHILTSFSGKMINNPVLGKPPSYRKFWLPNSCPVAFNITLLLLWSLITYSFHHAFDPPNINRECLMNLS